MGHEPSAIAGLTSEIMADSYRLLIDCFGEDSVFILQEIEEPDNDWWSFL